MEEARRKRDVSLEQMEKAAHRFKQEVIWGKVSVGRRDCIWGNQRNGGVLVNQSEWWLGRVQVLDHHQFF